MADDLTKKGPADRTRVNIHEDYEIRYWTEKFGVNADTLKAAVQKAGTNAADVAREILKSKP